MSNRVAFLFGKINKFVTCMLLFFLKKLIEPK